MCLQNTQIGIEFHIYLYRLCYYVVDDGIPVSNIVKKISSHAAAGTNKGKRFHIYLDNAYNNTPYYYT